MLSLSHPTFLLPLPMEGRKGAKGASEDRQACAAAQALKPSKPFSIASQRRMALPTNVSLTIVDVIGRDSSTAQVFDRPLRPSRTESSRSLSEKPFALLVVRAHFECEGTLLTEL